MATGFYRGKSDIQITSSGDLVVDGNGDLRLTDGADWLGREFLKRLRTNNPEWWHHPGIGAGLELHMGSPNTRNTANAIKADIESALQDPELVGSDRVSVEVVPVGASSVNVYINVNTTSSSLELLKLVIDYNTGVVVEIPDVPARPSSEEKKSFSGNKYLDRLRR
jgi:hypothetical protein